MCAAHVLGVLDEAGGPSSSRTSPRAARSARRSLRSLSGGALVLAMSPPQHRAPAAVRARVLAAIDSGGASGRQLDASVIALPRTPVGREPGRRAARRGRGDRGGARRDHRVAADRGAHA
jgi:hypothetical protein